MGTRIVLITGTADYWGRRLADRLTGEPNLSLIGLDTNGSPGRTIEGLDPVVADVRDPSLAEFLQSEAVDTVCHLKFSESVSHSPAVADLNLGGTRNVVNACMRAGVQQIILRSSLGVYGAHPDNAAALNEAHSLRARRRYGYTKNRLDIEAMRDGFLQNAVETSITYLRFANIVGPTANTPMTRFLKLSPATTLLGFDPMQQIVHEDDVVGALAHAVLSRAAGTYNIAANSPLPLSRIMALTRTVPLPVPHPLVRWWTKISRKRGADVGSFLPIEPDYLRYSLVADVAKMRSEFGFEPVYSAEETLREFKAVGQHSRGMEPAPLSEADAKRFRLAIEHRRRMQDQSPPDTEKGEEYE